MAHSSNTLHSINAFGRLIIEEMNKAWLQSSHTADPKKSGPGQLVTFQTLQEDQSATFIVGKLDDLVARCDSAIGAIATLAETILSSSYLNTQASFAVSRSMQNVKNTWFQFTSSSKDNLFTLAQQNEVFGSLSLVLNGGTVRVGRTLQNLRSIRAQLQELTQRFARRSSGDDRLLAAMHLHAIDSSVTRLRKETEDIDDVSSGISVSEGRGPVINGDDGTVPDDSLVAY